MMNRVFQRGGSSLFQSTKFGLPLAQVGSRALSQEVMDNFKHLEVAEVKPFVYSVTLNRPEKRNAMNLVMWNEIRSVFEQLAQDEDCRSVVISGNGSMFTSGIDLTTLTQFASVVTSDEDVAKKCKLLYQTIKNLQDGLTAIEKCPKPVIAAIHNACVGGGIDLITATDIRLCTQDAWFCVKEVDIGLAADVGTLQRLPKVIGNQSLVRELCLTARKFDSAEAEKAGMVSKVYSDRESCLNAAIEMAENIAQKSPVAVQATKECLNYSRDHSVDDGLEHIAQKNKTLLQSKDLMVAAMAAMTKSKEAPVFSDRKSVV